MRVRCAELLPDFNKLLIEEYVDGREFTVLVAASGLALTPFEFVFKTADHFKTYRMKVTEHHTSNNIPVTDPTLSQCLKRMAIRIFRGFEAESYARIDIRSNSAGELFFLEINCECSIFYPEGSEGSADYILKYEPMGHAGFLQLVIADGIRRHQIRQKPFQACLASDGNLACFAARDLFKRRNRSGGRVLSRNATLPAPMNASLKRLLNWPPPCSGCAPSALPIGLPFAVLMKAIWNGANSTSSPRGPLSKGKNCYSRSKWLQTLQAQAHCQRDNQQRA